RPASLSAMQSRELRLSWRSPRLIGAPAARAQRTRSMYVSWPPAICSSIRISLLPHADADAAFPARRAAPAIPKTPVSAQARPGRVLLGAQTGRAENRVGGIR